MQSTVEREGAAGSACAGLSLDNPEPSGRRTPDARAARTPDAQIGRTPDPQTGEPLGRRTGRTVGGQAGRALVHRSERPGVGTTRARQAATALHRQPLEVHVPTAGELCPVPHDSIAAAPHPGVNAGPGRPTRRTPPRDVHSGSSHPATGCPGPAEHPGPLNIPAPLNVPAPLHVPTRCENRHPGPPGSSPVAPRCAIFPPDGRKRRPVHQVRAH